MVSNKIFSVKSTERVKRLREKYLNAESEICTERAILVTKVYKENEDQPVIIKRALALKKVLEKKPIFINEDELIMGYPSAKPRSTEVFPEMSVHWIKKELDDFENREYNPLKITRENKRILRNINSYWEGRTICDRIERIREKRIQHAVECGLISNTHQWNGLAHAALTYGMEKILKLGYIGLKKEIKKEKNKFKMTGSDYLDHKIFYEAAEISCNAIIIFSERYSTLAKKMSLKEKNIQRKNELEKISKLCSRVPKYPAITFWEALQSLWFVQLVLHIESNGFANSPGRIDQYLFPFYRNDINKRIITQEKAQELLECLWLKFNEILRVDDKRAAEINAGYAVNQNVVIGGVDCNGKDVANELSYMCLLANKHIGLGQPNFSSRIHKDSSNEFLEKISEVISYGNGMPILYNDELIIPGLMNLNIGISLKEARNYTPTGCVELVVEGMWNRGNGGYFNIPKVLEISLNNGKCMLTDKNSGLLSTNIDYTKFTSFNKFFNIFKKQLKEGIKILVTESNNIDKVHMELAPLPFLSTLYSSAIDKGLDVTQGGEYYNFSAPLGFGFATVADSLIAIKKIVFEEKKISLSKFVEILEDNYKNYEVLRQYIINKIPKFGNDCNNVDNYVVAVTNIFFNELEKYKNIFGNKFVPGILSVTAQVGLGYKTAATPDGRLAKTPLSDGLSPMFGRDLSGPTAALKSIAKIELKRAINGVIVNQRLAPLLLKTEVGKKKFVQLLRSFIDIGGFHWQFNVVSSNVLKDAQMHPEKHKDLVVRVAGYSALFISLSKKTQNSIIARTVPEI